ncbi:MAG TPA: hypothetical protein VFW46_22425 [Stellaceae bacterium]|nr:hypothetical protein [Stellaceae bacterium]
MDQPYLSALLAVILSRSVERGLLVLVGGLAIYLGYHLFVVIPGHDRSEGRIRLPGGVSIFLTRIGPGVFFALFGCALVGYAISRPVDLKVPAELGAARTGDAAARPMAQYVGFGEVAPGLASLDTETVIARLNGYLDDMRQRLDRPAADELASAIRVAKLSVMAVAWKPDWGDRDAFAKWVDAGADANPPMDRAARAVLVFGTKLR